MKCRKSNENATATSISINLLSIDLLIIVALSPIQNCAINPTTFSLQVHF